jgi:hypothetical protein
LPELVEYALRPAEEDEEAVGCHERNGDEKEQGTIVAQAKERAGQADWPGRRQQRRLPSKRDELRLHRDGTAHALGP